MADGLITAESRYLRGLARRVADACVAHTSPAAILLTGSAAQGVADRYSDLDLICYYEALPPDEATARLHDALGATNPLPIGGRESGQFAEQFAVDGVVCQIAHTTIGAWEAEMRSVLEGLDVTSPAQKAVSGLAEGIPLHGGALIGGWKERVAEYPDALARAMVVHHLQLFPLWYIAPALPARDAGVWVRQMLVEGAQHLLGVLAGLNGRYYSAFQFKRMGAFVSGLRVAPPEIGARIEALLTMEQEEAIRALEALAGEIIALVRAAMPDVDTSAASGRLGKRHPPWTLPGSA
jgi:hypothetical protein